MTTKEKKGSLHYLNPIVWFRMLFSYILTFVLFIDHFFVFILLAILVSLVAFFSYDRYASMTYDGSTSSEYMGGAFGENKAYKSPLIQGNKSLIRDLSSYYVRQRGTTKTKKAQKVQQSVNDEALEVSRPHSSIQKEVNSRLKK